MVLMRIFQGKTLMNATVWPILERVGWSILGCFILFQLYVGIRLYLLASCVIPTYSMSPTLLAGDYIIASLRIPGRRELEQKGEHGEYRVAERKSGTRPVRNGDVVIFNFPYARDKNRMALTFDLFYCKRCVATPGETYSWRGGGKTKRVYLPRQGESLPIDTLNLPDYKRCIEYETGQLPQVKEGTVIHADTVMHSYRFTGNYYFMRGDNYGDSYDSRFWGILHEDFILGVGLFTWFSKDKATGKIRWERMFREL